MEKIDNQESVLVVPRNVLDAACPHTFCHQAAEIRSTLAPHYRFLDRNAAEHDLRYKQVIPYIMANHGDRYLLIQRTRKQTEARLHDKYSLGIGGHVNDSDANDSTDLIQAGMRREMAEEIRFTSEESCTFLGIINDDSTEVARVHVGFLYLLILGSPQFTILERGHYTADWKPVDEISHYYDQMESWAQIVHDYVLYSAPEELIKKWRVSR